MAITSLESRLANGEEAPSEKPVDKDFLPYIQEQFTVAQQALITTHENAMKTIARQITQLESEKMSLRAQIAAEVVERSEKSPEGTAQTWQQSSTEPDTHQKSNGQVIQMDPRIKRSFTVPNTLPSTSQETDEDELDPQNPVETIIPPAEPFSPEVQTTIVPLPMDEPPTVDLPGSVDSTQRLSAASEGKRKSSGVVMRIFSQSSRTSKKSVSKDESESESEKSEDFQSELHDAFDHNAFDAVLPVMPISPRKSLRFNQGSTVVEHSKSEDSEDEDVQTANAAKVKNFDVLEIWLVAPADLGIVDAQGSRESKAIKNKALIKAATKALHTNHAGKKNAGEDGEGGPMCFTRFMIPPSSPSRAIFDLLSLLLVVYDLASIPLILLMDPPNNDLFSTMEWITRLWWTTDIPLSFISGYLLPDGTVVMDPVRIARKYLTRWFPLDVIIVGVDWVEIVAGGSSGNTQSAARMGKASRTFRIIRMIRLLRLARMNEVLKFIRSRCRTEIVIVCIDICKVLGSILAIAHFIACGWYGVGRTEKHSQSWIYIGGYNREKLGYQYLVAFHWSISQFNGGMEQVVPIGQHERIYAVFVLLICWVMAAAFVSALTSEMTRLHILASQQARQVNILQRYLKQCRISDKLALRVQRNAAHALSEQQRLMPESEVELLEMVSEPLRVELHFEMYSPVLEVHPFFREYVECCPQVIRKVCHDAMSTLLIATGDVVFNAGEIPNSPKMYVVCTGNLDYIPLAGQIIEVNPEHFLSEPVLWTVWMHRGVLKATGEGRLCVLDAIGFQDIAGSFNHTDLDPRSYARAFVKQLNRMIQHGELDHIHDMPLGFEESLAKDQLHARTSRRISYRDGGKSSELKISSKRRRSAFMDPTSHLQQVNSRRVSVMFGQ